MTKWVKRTKDQISWVLLNIRKTMKMYQWIRSVVLKVCDHQSYRKCIVIFVSSQLREQLEPFPVKKTKPKNQTRKKAETKKFARTILLHSALSLRYEDISMRVGQMRVQFLPVTSESMFALYEEHMQFSKPNNIAVKRRNDWKRNTYTCSEDPSPGRDKTTACLYRSLSAAPKTKLEHVAWFSFVFHSLTFLFGLSSPPRIPVHRLPFDRHLVKQHVSQLSQLFIIQQKSVENGTGGWKSEVWNSCPHSSTSQLTIFPIRPFIIAINHLGDSKNRRRSKERNLDLRTNPKGSRCIVNLIWRKFWSLRPVFIRRRNVGGPSWTGRNGVEFKVTQYSSRMGLLCLAPWRITLHYSLKRMLTLSCNCHRGDIVCRSAARIFL